MLPSIRNPSPQALIHCPHLTKLTITDNPKLETLMIWSDELTELDLTGCNSIISLKVQCPSLVDTKIPPLKLIEQHVKPVHPPLSMLLKENYTDAAKVRGVISRPTVAYW